ncbi:MAG TPA: 3-hydroxyacyl-CoA dehydrogenase NAD-binding domain-containing protein [Archangium sp.]|uniref:3-hydroxyacyl-CoA dehydrogenase NAD-binding domain-containing protein n=1 Tax=Archangium sp. TaxID=1872627 RepID=UPI002E35A8A3|nr:3-hydroxyacyl-CoA dehydrogenase NAD-binding domain-containing protein [Archangium sp.]HEX5752025.1 3-hydroxyacyl-CoA dehydrogenase NAD-binding domain-containing protein [Archangium sp.]
MSGRFEARGDVGILWIDNPPVNAISHAVRVALLDGLKQAESNGAIQAVVIACAGRTFMAGADITEFSGPLKSPGLPEVIDALDAFSKPVVAAIHGTAFGGGFEVALACDHRVAVASAQVGLPEVKLGLLPGAGGTQRLPRLVGVEPALQAMISGDPIPAPVALGLGAIDKLVEGDLTEAAVIFAREKIGSPRRRVRDLTLAPNAVPAGFFDTARQRTAKEKRNLFSPQRIIDAVEAAVTLPFDQGIQRERDLFLECARNSQSKALQHVFFAERQVSKIPGLPADVKPRPIQSVAIIGAGTMGGGIAMNFANAGIPVTLLEVNQEGLDRGLGVIRKNYEATAAKGRLTAEQVETRMGLIRPTLSYDALAGADLVIEAVFETLEVKKKVFETLDRVARKGAILATNTSYLSIDTIAGYTSRPADVLGMHFFSPANVMKLLEVVRGARTAPDVLATALDIAKRIKKVGVVAGNSHGFIGNRMLEGYMREGSLLVLEGATPQQVDQALVKFGMPMGVLQMGDLAGLDIGYKSRKDRDPTTFEPRAGAVADKLVEMGRLGQKTQAGYYDYQPGNRTPVPSDVVARVIEETAAGYGIQRREISEQEILERCFLAMVNIGCEVLREGIAYRSSDIDIVYLYGYGFPAHRGGPMFWAEHEVGLPQALEKIREYGRKHGARWWTPSPLLERWVAEGKGFAQAV